MFFGLENKKTGRDRIQPYRAMIAVPTRNFNVDQRVIIVLLIRIPFRPPGSIFIKGF